MSVIAVRKYHDKIEISGDEQVTCGDMKYNMGSDKLLYNASKIYEVNGMVIGGVGLASQASLLKIFAKTHKPGDETDKAVMDFMVEFDDWARKRDSGFSLYNDYLIILETKVFLCSGISVNEVGEFNAIGSGAYLAIGALYMGANTEKAVEVAKEYSLYCGGKTNTITQMIRPSKRGKSPS